MLTIYHNTRCSKSREALELARQFAAQQSIELNVVDYQQTPLTRDQLVALHKALQATQPTSVRDMLRENEEAYATLQLAQANDDELLDALASHPILLQRPIVRFDDRAVITRPSQRAHLILKI